MEFFKRVPKIDFMGKRKITYAISAFLMIGSLVLLGVRGLNFGIDFTGGVTVEAEYPGEPDAEKARAALRQAGFPNATVQTAGPNGLAVVVRQSEGEDVNQVSARVRAALQANEPQVKLLRTDVVGPQVGRDLAEQGGLALLFTLIGILIYVGFRFEWKMGAGTVLAALHDPIVILGFFSATQMTFDLSVLAAVLAVIGYSINDTVVVFDRVREVFREVRKATPTEVINAAINQTMSRTLMTSISVLLVVVSLYVFGGEALRGFSIAIIVGVLVGTYSSIFVAGSLAHDMGLKAQDLMSIKKEDPELDALP